MDAREVGTVGAAVTSGGAAATATAAAACCVPVLSPLLVTVLGASAAWVSGLKPYSPYLLLGSLLLLAYAFRRVYGRREACRAEPPSAPRRAWLGRITLGLRMGGRGRGLLHARVIGAGTCSRCLESGLHSSSRSGAR